MAPFPVSPVSVCRPGSNIAFQGELRPGVRKGHTLYLFSGNRCLINCSVGAFNGNEAVNSESDGLMGLFCG